MLIGPEESQQTYTIHKHLICNSSKFFHAACSKLWAEGKEKLVRLPEANPEAFQAYVVWVYTGRVIINKADDVSEINQTIRLYLLGDVLDDRSLRNEAMRALVRQNGKWKVQPSVELIQEIWDSTTSGSRLRKMIVDLIIMRRSRDNMTGIADFPKDILHELTSSLLKRVDTQSHTAFASGLDGYLEPEPTDTSKIAN